MRQFRIWLVCAVLSVTIVAAQTPQSVEGDWVGEVRLQDLWQFAMLHVSSSGPHLEGLLELPFAGEKWPLTDLELKNRSLTFSATKDGRSLNVTGVVKDRIIDGDSARFGHLARLEFSKYTAGYIASGAALFHSARSPNRAWERLRRQ